MVVSVAILFTLCIYTIRRKVKLKDNISDADAALAPPSPPLYPAFQQVVIEQSTRSQARATLVMAEHRDGRFLYEVPLSTAGHNHRNIHGGGGHTATRRSFLTTQNNIHRRQLNKGTRSPSDLNWSSGRKNKQQRRNTGSSSTSTSLLTEYTTNSTIHGVKYLGGPERSWPERLWWIIMFVISLSVCSALIMNTYKKWTSDPVIVTFSQMATPVWRIPFPAVTICPTNIVRQSQFNFTDILTKIQDKDAKLKLTAIE